VKRCFTQGRTTALLNERLHSILLRLEENPEVLQELINLISTRLIEECEGILGDFHKAEAEVNTIMHKLYAKANQYDPERPALPYVISVARNHCRDILRLKANRLEMVSLEDVGDIKLSGVAYSEDLVLDMCFTEEEDKISVLGTVGESHFSQFEQGLRDTLFSHLSEQSIQPHMGSTQHPGSLS